MTGHHTLPNVITYAIITDLKQSKGIQSILHKKTHLMLEYLKLSGHCTIKDDQ
jgi:hypothetical protein